jgi:hypothetical protein
MSELDFRPSEADVIEPATDATKEQGPTPTSQQGTPRAEKSMFRRIVDSRAARPIAALLGLTIAGGAVEAAVNSGSSGSQKAPDAIVGQPAPGFETFTPEQIAEKARLEQITLQQREAQATAAVPEMSEDEKRQKITEVLQEVNPGLLPLLENGPLPYYGENKEWGANFRVVSFVPKDAMPPETGFNNKDLAVAPNEHWFEIAISGMPLSDFQTDGKLDMDKSNKHQADVRAVKERLVVILPSQMNGEPTPWAGKGNSDGMFLADTVLEGTKGKLQLLFDPARVADAPPAEGHHADKRIYVNAGGGGG